MLSIVAAIRAVRSGPFRRVQIGPLDARLLSAYGLITGGPEEIMDAFVTAMQAEAKKLKIEIAPVEFIGNFE